MTKPLTKSDKQAHGRFQKNVIVCLTTIPSRVSGLTTLIEDIEKQTMQPMRVELYVPENYEARSLGTIDLTLIPSDIHVVEVERDLGPATKVLPASMRYRSSKNVVLIYCDDDRRYDSEWIQRLSTTCDLERRVCAAEHITLVQRQLTLERYKNRDMQYRIKRALSFGRWRPKEKHPEHRIAAGFDGVAISPNWLSNDALEIPKEFIPVDDVWLSGMLVKNGVEIKQTDRIPNQGSQPKITQAINFGETQSLAMTDFNDMNRIQLDARCIKYFQSKFGIWL